MTKKSVSKIEQALSKIANHAYNSSAELESGLPTGGCPEMGFDEQLILDIAQAFTSWQARKNQIQDPYCVWYFNSSSWSKVTKDLYQEDAYKEWYRLTSGGRINSKPSFDSYYFLGPSSLTLEGRHDLDAEKDDFSIRYLLNKSFGE